MNIKFNVFFLKVRLRRGYFFVRENMNVRRNLATSASHPLFDGKVGHMMASLFDHGTRTFSVTGTHRCFSDQFSDCSGKTSVCGQSEPFRMSDASHVGTDFYAFLSKILLKRKRKDRSCAPQLAISAHRQQRWFRQNCNGQRR